ncbi:MAG: hypothetical protein AAF605_08980 [Myxococcota bacterium]
MVRVPDSASSPGAALKLGEETPAYSDSKSLFPPAHTAHRDHLDRSIVIASIGHHDRSEATQGISF